ncbi:MAG: hydrogenase maturation protease [Desulfomicrobium escambiense]|nr:hydrogenase maturation protease [Desulfomicrobium escambiense]
MLQLRDAQPSRPHAADDRDQERGRRNAPDGLEIEAPGGTGCRYVKTIVLGLGNTILSDDGAGVYVARALKGRLGAAADVREAELAGLDLMKCSTDTIARSSSTRSCSTASNPGSFSRMRPDDIRTTPRLASFHDIDMVTALALGRRLQFHMPEEVVIFGCRRKIRSPWGSDARKRWSASFRSSPTRSREKSRGRRIERSRSGSRRRNSGA